MSENNRLHVHVERPVLEQEEINKTYGLQKTKHEINLEKRVTKCCKKMFSVRKIKQIVPSLEWLFTSYRWRSDCLGDIIAGATVAVMHIPQGMAYAMLGQVPPITGIHMAFYPVLMYALLGTSRHISIGTFAVVCLMTGSAVTTNADTHRPLEVAAAVSFLVGIFHIIMSFLRLGTLSSVLSEPLVTGFSVDRSTYETIPCYVVFHPSVGAAFHALVSQLKDLLGLNLPRHDGPFNIPLTLYELAVALPNTNLAAFTVSLIAMTILYVYNEVLKPIFSKYCTVPLPIELIVVVLASLIGSQTGIFETYGLRTVGEIPTGLKEFALPPIDLLPKVVVEAATIAVVSYAIALSLGLMFAGRCGYEVEANQELAALGSANLLGSFFSCMPVTASPSRSALQLSVGGRTQLASVFSCCVLLAVLLWMGPFFESLPRCVLASVIIVALKPLMLQIGDVVHYSRLSLLDGALWLLTFLTVVLINLDIGLGVGLVASLFILLLQGSSTHSCTLEPLPGTDIYVNPKLYSQTTAMKGVLVFRFCGLLNFASQGTLKQNIRKIFPINSQKTATLHTYHSVVMDLSGTTRMDPAGVSALLTVRNDLSLQRVNIFLASPNSIVLASINRYCSTMDIVNFQIFPSLHDAVLYAEMVGLEYCSRATSNMTITDTTQNTV